MRRFVSIGVLLMTVALLGPAFAQEDDDTDFVREIKAIRLQNDKILQNQAKLMELMQQNQAKIMEEFTAVKVRVRRT
jgi:hypothetical protein